MNSVYYRGAAGVIIVYDITSLESFNKIDSWLEEARRYCNNPVITVVGNKNDKTDREVTRLQGAKWALDRDLDFFEGSAKKEEDVIECVFEKMIKKIMEKKNEKSRKSAGSSEGIFADEFKTRIKVGPLGDFEAEAEGKGCSC